MPEHLNCADPGSSSIGVLICDDMRSIRTLLEAIIDARAGMHVVGQAENGALAVLAAGRLQPDVILLDLSMPVLSGLDALVEIRRVASHAKVIVLTGFADRLIEAEALEDGADSYIEKGVHPEAIADAIEAVIRRVTPLPATYD